MLLRRFARPLLATAFVADGVDALVHPEPRTQAATALVQQGRQSLPDNLAGKLPSDPGTVVRVTAITQVSAGVLLAFGKVPRLASLALAATVIPATVTEQDFWAEKDPDRKAAKRTAFLKDVSLLGGLMIASADTGGKPSLGWRGRRAASDATAAVSAALPFATAADSPTAEALRRHAFDAAVRARELGDVAAAVAQERGAEIAETVREHGPEWADFAKGRGAKLAEKAAELAEIAQHRGTDLAGRAQHRGAELAEIAQHRSAELAERAQHRGAELAEIAKERGPELASTARERGAELTEQAHKRGARLAAKAERRAQKAQPRVDKALRRLDKAQERVAQAQERIADARARVEARRR